MNNLTIIELTNEHVWKPTPRTADVTVTKIAGYVRVRILMNRFFFCRIFEGDGEGEEEGEREGEGGWRGRGRGRGGGGGGGGGEGEEDEKEKEKTRKKNSHSEEWRLRRVRPELRWFCKLHSFPNIKTAVLECNITTSATDA